MAGALIVGCGDDGGGNDGDIDAGAQDASADASRDASVIDAATDAGTGDAGITLNANQVIDYAFRVDQAQTLNADFVINRTQNATIRSFAQTILDRFEDARARQVMLVTSLGLSPEMSTPGMDVVADGFAINSIMQRNSIAVGDGLYLDWQVQFFQRVLSAIDSPLLQGTSGALLSELMRFRDDIVSSLDLAKSVRSMLTDGGVGDAGL